MNRRHDPKLATLLASLPLLFAVACAAPGEEPAQRRDTGAPAGPAGQWRLEAFGGSGGPEPPLDGTELTLDFTEPGRAGGSSGCNRFHGAYEAGPGTLSFGNLASTRRACPPEILEQEQRFLGGITGTTAYSLEDDRLTLVVASGAVTLVFRRVESPGIMDGFRPGAGKGDRQ
jgi:heat shock protein HslJ